MPQYFVSYDDGRGPIRWTVNDKAAAEELAQFKRKEYGPKVKVEIGENGTPEVDRLKLYNDFGAGKEITHG